jgi:hypothetical protein
MLQLHMGIMTFRREGCHPWSHCPWISLRILSEQRYQKGISLSFPLSNFCALLAFSSCGFYYSTLIILAILFLFICFVCNF